MYFYAAFFSVVTVFALTYLALQLQPLLEQEVNSDATATPAIIFLIDIILLYLLLVNFKFCSSV